MMKSLILILSIVSTCAAPGVIWQAATDKSSPVVHDATEVTSEAFFRNAILNTEENTNSDAVVFLLGRGPRGTETFSTLAAGGFLPNIADKQRSASSIHYHISGLNSASSVAADMSRLGYKTRLVNLEEFLTRLSSHDDGARNQVINSAVLIVNVDAATDPKKIDSAVVQAIESKSFKSVVLAAVRSTEEVRQERVMRERRRLDIMEQAGSGIKTSASHRRLEEAAGDDAAADNNAVDLSGIYYVSLTPNILSGILFFILFTVITYIGISCMGMIAGQDVFVSKMPAIGREA